MHSYASLEVAVPVADVYRAWSRFETFPRYFEDIQSVEPLEDGWARLRGEHVFWTVHFVERIPGRLVKWQDALERTDGALHLYQYSNEVSKVFLHLDSWNEEAKSVLARFRDHIEGPARPLLEAV